MSRKPAFQPAGAIRGRIDWSCPYCGTVQNHRLNPGCIRLQCQSEDCRIVLEISLAFRPPCKKRGGRPRDTIMELAPLPLALLLPRRLSAHACTHVMLPAADEPVQPADHPE